MQNICHECQAICTDHQTCLDCFHTMGFWELDHQLLDVHHLMVLSFYLQHPQQMSPEWLQGAQWQLVQFLEQGVSPQEMRQQMAKHVDSGKRDYTMTARPDSHAGYQYPITWTMTAKDVINAGIEQYYPSVEKWARSILESLRESGNLSPKSFLK